MKPHHFAVLRWFDHYRVREDTSSEGTTSEEGVASDNFLTRSIDPVAPMEREAGLQKRLKNVQEEYAKNNRKKTLDYIDWVGSQANLLKWVKIQDNFNPLEDPTDLVAMRKIVGNQFEVTDENLGQLLTSYKQCLQRNINDVEDSANKACFLQGLKVDMSFSPSTALNSEAILNVLVDKEAEAR